MSCSDAIRTGLPIISQCQLSIDSINAEALAAAWVVPLPCDVDRPRELGRTAIHVGSPILSSPVRLASLVIPSLGISGLKCSTVSSGERVRCIPSWKFFASASGSPNSRIVAIKLTPPGHCDRLPGGTAHRAIQVPLETQFAHGPAQRIVTQCPADQRFAAAKEKLQRLGCL